MLPLLEDLLAKRLLLVTGKGGIGKTLVAGAFGQAAASRGVRTLIAESAATDQVAPLFGHAPVGHDDTQVAPNLWCINLDPTQNFREYVVKYLKQPGLYDRVFGHRVVQSFINTLPGFGELMMLGRIFYSAELAPPPRPGILVFDGFASGHFLSLMTTPDAILGAGLGGPLLKETARVRAYMADPKVAGVLFVTTPEELVVSECLEFLPKLAAKSPAKLRGVVLNRVPLSLMPGATTTVPTSPYLAAKHARAAAAMAVLREGLANLAEEGLHVPCICLPELGAVHEPWAPDFGLRLLQEAREL